MNLIVIAHPDDEAIWFGGLLPYLTRVKQEKCVVVAMCCTPDHVRAQELRNACERYGSGIEVEFGGFQDCNLRDTTTNPVTFHIDANFAYWGGRNAVVSYLAYLIRLHKPTNIYTHDLDGEGYHSNHICTALAVKDAAEAAATEIYADHLTHLQRHRVSNVYFHLYDENKIEFDWSKTVDGKTLLDYANDGLQCHISQHCPAVKNNSHLWGSLNKVEKPKTHHLGDLIEKYNCKIVAEVGVLRCATSGIVLRQCSTIEKYFCVDPWMTYEVLEQSTDDKKLEAYSTTDWQKLAHDAYYWALREPRAEIVRLPSVIGASVFDDKFFDIVYIDANHAYRPLIEDVLAWLPKIKDDGVMSGHDYTGSWPGVVQAVRDIFGTEGENHWRLPGGGWYAPLTKEKKLMFTAKCQELLK